MIYRLRKEARWHDGSPVTPEDVIFSMETLKKQSPFYSSYYRHVVKAEKIGERDIKFTFDVPGNRELPHIVGELPVLPKHCWEGTDSQGRKRDISATTLEKPLGSGPYRIKDFVAGRSVRLERVKDYWGASLPARSARIISTNCASSSSGTIWLRWKHSRPTRRTGSRRIRRSSGRPPMTFPAVTEKRVLKEEFPINDSGRMQGFVLNLRRDQFKDARLRRAFNYAFDFEEMNKQLFFSQYKRINSYFEGTELACSGVPEGQELQILETLRDKVPPEVFTTPFVNPVGGNPEAVRANLREATKLLKEAGFEVRERKLVDPAGRPVTAEILVQDPSAERIALFFKPSLERIGVTTSIRVVDDVQYQNRLRNFDFDIIIDQWGESLSPGNEQREFWGSQSADQAGSKNTIGIKNPAIDALIDRVIFAKDRAGLVAATRALDRVLLWNFYVVPQFTYPFSRYARWDRFSHAEPLPKYGRSGLPDLVVVRCGEGKPDRQTILKDRSRMALLTRRHALGLGIGALSAMRLGPVAAENGEFESHGMSAFGDLKYPADFHHFDYVNPAAPKGGVFSLIPPNRAYNQSFFTFNSLNAYILKGEGAQGMDMTFASLMARASDEPDAMYGLAAKSVRISPDKLNYQLHDPSRGTLSRRHEADRA